MELYHGTSEEKPFEIKGFNPVGVDFGGIFASASYDAAASHGDNVFSLEVRDDAILTAFHLVYEVEYADTISALEKAFGSELSEEESDLLWDAVIEEKGVDEDALCEVLGIDDLAEASWECQRLRGQVAKYLGFQAVEMNDEHGTSYLVLPGVQMKEAE